MSTERPESAGQGGDLRERIVRASVELVEEQGLAGLSMREVARRAGVSHQAPYHHFADREAILGAIAEEGFRILSTHLSECIARAGGAPHERIATAGRTYVEFACAHPAHFRVMFRPELVNLERCPGAQAEGDRAFELLQQAVGDAIAEGLPAEPSVEAVVLMCWSIAHGLACLALDGPLAIKTPHAERATQVKAVTDAFGNLLALSAAATKARPAAQGAPAARSEPIS